MIPDTVIFMIVEMVNDIKTRALLRRVSTIWRDIVDADNKRRMRLVFDQIKKIKRREHPIKYDDFYLDDDEYNLMPYTNQVNQKSVHVVYYYNFNLNKCSSKDMIINRGRILLSFEIPESLHKQYPSYHIEEWIKYYKNIYSSISEEFEFNIDNNDGYRNEWILYRYV